MANGATLFSDPTKSSLIVTISAEWNSMEAVSEALSEGIQSGNGNQMSAGNEAEMLDHTTAITTWIGQLGGTQLYATVVAQLQQNGTTQLVLELSRTPIYQCPRPFGLTRHTGPIQSPRIRIQVIQTREWGLPPPRYNGRG